MIAYFIGNISTKKYQNPFMYVKVIASQRWDVFETRCIVNANNGSAENTGSDNRGPDENGLEMTDVILCT